MVSYADTSFLLSLYVDGKNTERAFKLLPAIHQNLPLTPLHRLEMKCALAQHVFRFRKGLREQAMDQTAATEVWTNIETDTHGIFSGGQQLDWITVINEAERLADRHTPFTGTASLDTLHIAAAVSLGAETFISFDDKQRDMANREGLIVLD